MEEIKTHEMDSPTSSSMSRAKFMEDTCYIPWTIPKNLLLHQGTLTVCVRETGGPQWEEGFQKNHLPAFFVAKHLAGHKAELVDCLVDCTFCHLILTLILPAMRLSFDQHNTP